MAILVLSPFLLVTVENIFLFKLVTFDRGFIQFPFCDHARGKVMLVFWDIHYEPENQFDWPLSLYYYKPWSHMTRASQWRSIPEWPGPVLRVHSAYAGLYLHHEKLGWYDCDGNGDTPLQVMAWGKLNFFLMAGFAKYINIKSKNHKRNLDWF